MNTNELLRELAKTLSKSGLTEERDSILRLMSLASSTEATDWQKVIESVDTGYTTGTSHAISYLLEAGKGLIKAGKVLKQSGVDQKAFEAAAKIVKQMKKTVSFDYNTLVKYSRLIDYDEEMIKAAQVSDAWKATSLFGKSIPIIGVVFSFLLALKNLAFGIYEFVQLVNTTGGINITWYQALDSATFGKLAYQNQNNPNKLVEISRATHVAKTVWDEGISFVANAIDFVKDFIFLMIDIFSGGSSIALDIGISVVIFILEMGAEHEMLGNYDMVLQSIKKNAEDKLRKLIPKFEKFWLEEETPQTLEFEKFWLEEPAV